MQACNYKYPASRLIIIINVINKQTFLNIQCMQSAKTELIPVIIGATGTISKSSRPYLSNLTGKHEIKELHKAAILGNAHTYFGKC
jgi:hypothetical protein